MADFTSSMPHSTGRLIGGFHWSKLTLDVCDSDRPFETRSGPRRCGVS